MNIPRQRYYEYFGRTFRIEWTADAGEGPIFELYDRIKAMYDRVHAEDRRFTGEERELLRSLRRRSFGRWEEELARRAAGEPPGFSVRRVNV